MASTSSSELAFTYSLQGVSIFVGQDYEQWSVLIRMLFVTHELRDIIEEGYELYTLEEEAELTTAKRKENEDSNITDARALSFMHQGVSHSILPRIMGVRTSKYAWEILKNQFGGYDKVLSIKLQNLCAILII